MLNNKHITEICKMGQGKDCCRYLTCGSEGFMCAKLNPSLAMILDKRVREETITARADNCKGEILCKK
jgi:hypothetical protein